MALFHSQLFWVAVSALIFVALAYRKLATAAAAALDARSAAVAAELRTADELKEQAKALLEDAKRKHAAAGAEAERVVADARLEAKRFAEESEIRLRETLERRTQLALEKIASYEHTVAESIRDNVLQSALEAVKNAISRSSLDGASDEFAESALSAAEKRFN